MTCKCVCNNCGEEKRGSGWVQILDLNLAGDVWTSVPLPRDEHYCPKCYVTMKRAFTTEMEKTYKQGIEDTTTYFREEFAKWERNQHGAGERCLSFSEMLEESIKRIFIHEA